jgi:hypothetical protein
MSNILSKEFQPDKVTKYLHFCDFFIKVTGDRDTKFGKPKVRRIPIKN